MKNKEKQSQARQKQLEEDVEAIRQLLEETAHKYNCYLSIFSFPTGTACVTSDVKVGSNGS